MHRLDGLAAGVSQGEVQAYEAVRRDFRQRYVESPGRSPADQVMDFMLHDRTRRFIGSGAQLMRWKLDVLMPFYDADLVHGVARLPHAWRKRDRFYTDMLTQIAPQASSQASRTSTRHRSPPPSTRSAA